MANVSIRHSCCVFIHISEICGPSVIKVENLFQSPKPDCWFGVRKGNGGTAQNLIFSAKIRKLIVWAFFHDVLSKMAEEEKQTSFPHFLFCSKRKVCPDYVSGQRLVLGVRMTTANQFQPICVPSSGRARKLSSQNNLEIYLLICRSGNTPNRHNFYQLSWWPTSCLC